VSELLKPFDPRLMLCYPISTRVNSMANDCEECSGMELVACRSEFVTADAAGRCC
jgi:hypothetical protein